MVENVKQDSAVQSYIPDPLVFTDAAANKVAELIAEENNPNLKLRVFVTGGGCSGFQYGFTFDENINDDDTVVEKHVCVKAKDGEEDEESGEGGESGGEMVVKLLIDPMSYQYLVGAEIDYKEDLNGAQFVIRNPNAKTTCGCGSSFSV